MSLTRIDVVTGSASVKFTAEAKVDTLELGEVDQSVFVEPDDTPTNDSAGVEMRKA